MNPAKFERRSLADIIMDKIAEKQSNSMEDSGAQPEAEQPSLNPKVLQVYTSIGKILKTYTAGKLPKAFKIIPCLNNWEEICWITQPYEWSPCATYMATRIFASNLNPKMAQRFYNIILLEKVRDDIREYKKLNYHYYMALKKSLYRPGAFYKGILLPLCEDGSCNLREACIIGSVLTKVSIPVIHSAAALLKLAEMRYTGANSLFIRVLLNKKYSLPVRVIKALVLHFSKCGKDKREMPVLWHQALLVFVQRYKDQLQPSQRDLLKAVMKVHTHYMITPEIRRELFAGGQATVVEHEGMQVS